jgi:hypothetical protein
MVASEIITRLNGVRRGRQDSWTARCPAHDDKKNSLSIAQKGGKVVLKCFAGCTTEEIVGALGLTMADLFADSRKKPRTKKTPTVEGVTLAQYSEAKRLPIEFLRDIGVEEIQYRGVPVLKIPYRSPDGSFAQRHRIRMAVRVKEADESCKWDGAVGGEIIPYGLDRLAEARRRGYVVLVEGESNSHTLWYHGEPAVGIPGALNWRPEWEPHLEGIPRILATIDPDEAGAKLQTKLVEGSLRDRLSFIHLHGVKDVSDLHCQDPTKFKSTWTQALTAAVTATQAIGELLDELVTFLRRFLIISEAQAPVIALWIVHTHVFEAADHTAYLAISSPEPECGKSLLLDVVKPVVWRPWKTEHVTVAALFRKIDAERPTLLLDESDPAFKGDKDYAEALRGILNSGQKRGGTYTCCVGQGKDISYRDFSTFCPKAIAGIDGSLPDTVKSRSIPVRMKRKAPHEKVERFRVRARGKSQAAKLQRHTEQLCAKLQAWAAGAVQSLIDAEPELPSSLTDRQQDGAEPLLAIADAAGGEWPNLARAALTTIFHENRAKDDSIGVRLLKDIRAILEKDTLEGIPSTDLVEALAEIETSPWAEWKKANH